MTAPGVVPARKRVALVAHDYKKAELLEWAAANAAALAQHDLFATGTTGRMLSDRLGLAVTPFLSGPLGGDLQIGAKLAEGAIDLLVFFWDPLEAQPHDPDVRALLRVAAVWDVPVAATRLTADYLFSSPLLTREYPRPAPTHPGYSAKARPNVTT